MKANKILLNRIRNNDFVDRSVNRNRYINTDYMVGIRLPKDFKLDYNEAGFGNDTLWVDAYFPNFPERPEVKIDKTL